MAKKVLKRKKKGRLLAPKIKSLKEQKKQNRSNIVKLNFGINLKS